MGNIVSASKLVAGMGHFEWKNIGGREQKGEKNLARLQVDHFVMLMTNSIVLRIVGCMKNCLNGLLEGN